MTQNQETRDPAKLIRDAADDLAGRIENLTERLGDAAEVASNRLRAAEDAAVHLARDLEPHARRVIHATEDLAREARKSVDRVVAGEKRRWYWPFH